MGTLEICIIAGVALGCVVALAQASGKKKKTKTKSKETKTAKTEQPKKEEAPQQDRSFKIEKKGRLARVSKNALTTNSRTAQIERVFAREPETDKSVYIGDNNNENIPPAEPALDTVVEEYKKNMSTGNAGYFSGDYNGIHLGGQRPSKQEQPQSLVEEKSHTDVKKSHSDVEKSHKDVEKSIPEFSAVNELLARMRKRTMANGIDSSEEEHQARQVPATNSNPPETDIDFNLIVEADAILNPKYKAFENRNKKTSI